MILIGFYLLYFNNTLPVSEGWGIYYSELLDQGLFPYTDFYYYLPPLGLLIDYAFWKCSFGRLIVFRMFYLIERLAMMSFMYYLMCRKYNCKVSSIAAIMGGIVGGSAVYDLVGDYNQTAIFFLVIMMYFAVKYVESKNENEKRKNLFLLGLFFGLSFLIKQSTGVAAGISYLIGYAAYSIKTKNKNWLNELLIISGSFLLCVALMAAVLVSKNAFLPFIDQVFLSASGSKGGIKSILFSSIFNVYFYHEIVVVLALILFAFGTFQDNNQRSRQSRFQVMIKVFIVLLTAYHLFSDQLFDVIGIVLAYKMIVFAFLGALLAAAVVYFYVTKRAKETIAISIIVGFAMELLIVYLNCGDICIYAYKASFFKMVSPFIYISIVLLALHFLYILFAEENVDYGLLMIDLGALCGAYSCLMNCGTSDVPNFVGFIVIPPVLCFVLNYEIKEKKRFSLAKDVAVMCLCLVLSFAVFDRKYCNAYSWWGTEDDAYSEKTESIDIEFLQGFKVSKERKQMYENINSVILSNMDEDDIIWSFPFCKMFNLTTDHIGENAFVPVLFYDVCPDSYAINDAKLLKENMPDFIIWSDIPTCMEIHEEVFRGGNPCGQREIAKLVQSNVRNKNYVLIGQSDNIFVYQKKEKEIRSTYFEDDSKTNSTLKQKY